MAQVPGEVKRRIVIELASFRSTLEVSEILREEYGIELSSTRICMWDVTKPYCRASKALRQLFHLTRNAYVEDAVKLNSNQQAYRLVRLERLATAAEARGDLALAAALIEQGAKDHGGCYTDYSKLDLVRRRQPTTSAEARARIEAWFADRKGPASEGCDPDGPTAKGTGKG